LPDETQNKIEKILKVFYTVYTDELKKYSIMCIENDVTASGFQIMGGITGNKVLLELCKFYKSTSCRFLSIHPEHVNNLIEKITD
jgi:hypothetical protein